MLLYTNDFSYMSTLKNYQLEIEKLIAEEDWAKAYQLCNKILNYDPENTTFIKLKRNIEKKVSQINSEAITLQLSQLQQLIKDQKYEEYLKAIAPLQSYAGQFPEISKNILKAKKLLEQEYHQKRETAFKEVVTEIQTNTHNLNHLQVIKELENLAKLGIHRNDIRNWEKKVKASYVQKELEQNKGLIRSKKYEDTILFLLKLKKFDQDNGQIINLIKKVNASYKEFNIENKKDYIFKTIEEIKTLFLSKKYEYCIELAERILTIDEHNLVVLKILQNAKAKSNIESEKDIINSIYHYYKEFPDTIAFKEKNYIKI